jgi:cytosine/adenosine deaminase-related metal-dependent hydrolase
MATSEAAIVVGLQAHVGVLEVGMVADIAVFGRDGLDPYQAVIDSRAEDVRLVLLGGVGMYGDANIQTETQSNEYCEAFDACGASKYICVQESPTATSRRDETLEDIRVQLYNILEGIGYPEEEQYGRGDELLPLVDCS